MEKKKKYTWFPSRIAHIFHYLLVSIFINFSILNLNNILNLPVDAKTIQLVDNLEFVLLQYIRTRWWSKISESKPKKQLFVRLRSSCHYPNSCSPFHPSNPITWLVSRFIIFFQLTSLCKSKFSSSIWLLTFDFSWSINFL